MMNGGGGGGGGNAMSSAAEMLKKSSSNSGSGSSIREVKRTGPRNSQVENKVQLEGNPRRNNSEFTRTLPTTQELDEDGPEEDNEDRLEGAIFMVAAESSSAMKKDGAAAAASKAKDADGTSFASTGSTDESSGDLPTPPDGGWGWVVVFASFMIHIIADGITYTFGIFVVELMEAFGEGRGTVSLIPSILSGVTLGVGPIASVLVNRFGCRAVTIAGSVLAAAGLAISAATPNVSTLYVTVGLCTGLGFGLIYLPAIVSVSMYFEKKRAFATGIAVCGSGLGTFLMAPLVHELIDRHGWENAIVITGAIVLLCVFLGALFRPIPSDESDDDSGVEAEGQITVEDVAGRNPDASGISQRSSAARLDTEEGRRLMAEMDAGDRSGGIPELRLNGESLRPLAVQMNGTAMPGTDKFGQYSNVARMALSHPVISLSNANSQSKSSVLQFGSHSRIYGSGGEIGKPGRSKEHWGRGGNRRTSNDRGVLFRKDIFYRGSLYNIPEYKSNPRRYSRQIAKGQQDEMTAALNIRAQSTSKLCQGNNGNLVQSPSSAAMTFSVGNTVVSLDARATATSPDGSTSGVTSHNIADETAFDEANNCKCCPSIGCCCDAFSAKTLGKMTDVNLMYDGIFIMFAVSNFLTSIGFNVPYVYTVDRAVQMGIEKENASFLLSVIGIANTLGRIVLGYVSDRPWLNRLYTYNISLAICGITMGMSNFCSDFASQAFYCAVFGVTSGAYVGLTSVVLVDLLGLDKLTNAFGLLLLFQGIASIIGPPIIGALYDAIGNYDSGFYFSGAMIFISGIMLFALPWMERNRRRKKSAKKCHDGNDVGDNNECQNAAVLEA